MDIHLKNLMMTFDGKSVIDDLNVTVDDGELVTLLGPSGCGKSTTLMLIAGLYEPTSGKILFDDQDMTDIPAEDRGIGMVFQNYALYPHLTVLKNIMFPLKMQKVPAKEAKERAIEMAKLVEIEHLLNRKPHQLSGGQQQRVAIARALVKKPRVLLLDEPLSNLDARLRLEMREEIRRIQSEINITTIFVTHDQEEAMSISDKIIIMNDGVIQQVDEPQTLYKKPVNEFVATFIGSPPINTFMRDGYKIGIRPEHLFLTTPEVGMNSGEVIRLETTGRDTLIKVSVEGNIIRALIDVNSEVKLGDIVYFGVEKGNLHFFDLETGMRLDREEVQYECETNFKVIR